MHYYTNKPVQEWFDQNTFTEFYYSDDGKCKGENLGYKYQLYYREKSGRPAIRCTGRPGTCKRNICECDKALAEKARIIM